MKLSHPLFAAAALAVALLPSSALAQKDDYGVGSVSEQDREMNAAKAEAKRTLPGFLKLLAAPPAGTRSYQIKYPLAGWEYIWVGKLRLEGDAIVGTLINDPEEPGYTFGQTVRVPLTDVADWGYYNADGVMQGHYTTRVLLKLLEPAEAAEIREILGWRE